MNGIASFLGLQAGQSSKAAQAPDPEARAVKKARVDNAAAPASQLASAAGEARTAPHAVPGLAHTAPLQHLPPEGVSRRYCQPLLVQPWQQQQQQQPSNQMHAVATNPKNVNKTCEAEPEVRSVATGSGPDQQAAKRKRPAALTVKHSKCQQQVAGVQQRAHPPAMTIDLTSDSGEDSPLVLGQRASHARPSTSAPIEGQAQAVIAQIKHRHVAAEDGAGQHRQSKGAQPEQSGQRQHWQGLQLLMDALDMAELSAPMAAQAAVNQLPDIPNSSQQQSLPEECLATGTPGSEYQSAQGLDNPVAWSPEHRPHDPASPSPSVPAPVRRDSDGAATREAPAAEAQNIGQAAQAQNKKLHRKRSELDDLLEQGRKWDLVPTDLGARKSAQKTHQPNGSGAQRGLAADSAATAAAAAARQGKAQNGDSRQKSNGAAGAPPKKSKAAAVSQKTAKPAKAAVTASELAQGSRGTTAATGKAAQAGKPDKLGREKGKQQPAVKQPPPPPQTHTLEVNSPRAAKLMLAACLGDAKPWDILSQRFSGMAALWFKATLKRCIKHVKTRYISEMLTPPSCLKQLAETLVVTPTPEAVTQEQQKNETRSIKLKVADLLMKQAARELNKSVQEVTSLDVLQHLPVELAGDDRLELYTVGEEDPRVKLRGEKGVRAKSDIPAGCVLGVYAGYHLLAMEYHAFRDSPPSKLFAHMLRDLDEWQAAQALVDPEEQAQIELPGPLADNIAKLHYISEGAASSLVCNLLRQCTSVEEVIYPVGSHPASSNAAPSARPVSKLVASAPVSAIKAALQQAMIKELRTPAEWRRHQLDVPEGFEEDSGLLSSWLDLDAAEWLQNCEEYGADFNTSTHTGACGKTLEELLTDCAPSREHTVMLSHDNNITVTAQLLHRKHLQSRPGRCGLGPAALVSYVNDPALTLPSSSSVLSASTYDLQGQQSNAQEVVVQVAGWPLLFLVARQPIAKGSPVSYKYGIQYWKAVLEKNMSLEKCAQLVRHTILLLKLQAQVQAGTGMCS